MSEHHYPDITKRRSELVQIIIAAVLLAFIMNLLGNIIYDYLRYNVRVYGIAGYALIIVLFIVVLFIGIMVLANMYLGLTVVRRMIMTLLINRVTGEVIPSIGYEPAGIAGAVLLEYVKNRGSPVFKEDLPNVDDEILRDLSEVIVVDWFIKSQTTHMTPKGVTIRYAIPFPRISKKHVNVSPSDLIKMFGENMFSDIVSMPQGPILHTSVSVPGGFSLHAVRHEWKGTIFMMGTDKIKFYKKLVSGAPGGSEFGIRGRRLNPLKFFAIRVFVDRVSYGEEVLLYLLGLKPVAVSERYIQLDNGSVIEGEDLKRLREWIEVDYQVVVAYRIRGWLFFHPRFLEVARWAQAMLMYAEEYFDISRKWDKIKLYQQEYKKLLMFIERLLKTRKK